MQLSFRRAPFLAFVALTGLVAAGCGGDSGSQTTTTPNKTFTVASAIVYGADAPAVGTVDDSAARAEGGPSIIPLATLTSQTGQTVVLWGTRDEAGKVTSVRQVAYRDGDVTLYGRYAANGGILSVLGASAGTSEDPALAKNAGSYVTFGPIVQGETNKSIEGTGVVFTDGLQSDSNDVLATIRPDGIVSVRVLDGEENRSQTARPDAVAKVLASRAEGVDPLDGLATVYQDDADRTKIVSGLLKIAGIVVEKPYSTYISNSANFLFLDKLSASYLNYTAQGFEPTTATDATTPLPYRSDLP